jgi:hypothetical protein
MNELYADAAYECAEFSRGLARELPGVKADIIEWSAKPGVVDGSPSSL